MVYKDMFNAENLNVSHWFNNASLDLERTFMLRSLKMLFTFQTIEIHLT